MKPIKFYFMHESPPCRAVQMVAAHLKVPLELKFLNLATGDHLKDPEFVALSHVHAVPTIDDDGFVLLESRAIMAYLVNKFAPGSTLYPNEPQLRAKVDMLLNFDIGSLYKAQGEYLVPLLRGKPIDEAKEEPFKKQLNLLDQYLSKNAYVCGDNLTIADLSIRAGLSFGEAAEYDFGQFKNVHDWMNRLAQLPYYKEVNEEPVRRFTLYIQSKKQV
ncbi:Glutathione S-transferase 1, isoform C [Halotydeus destructor]|nr:Glutathione S-transferase 1, isoform C [Halotydeus destructor]